MQLSLIAWIENNEAPEQLSLLSWLEAHEIAVLIESKLNTIEYKKCLTCLDTYPIESLFIDEMGWPICDDCK